VDYLDFDLEIGVGRGRKYPLAVVRSPAGEARETMQFPFDELALENQLLTLQNVLLRSGGKRRQILSPDEQVIQNFGRALFEALFTGEVHTRYALSQHEAFHQGKGLRLKLRIQSPKLAALPWEFLYDAGQAEYVCLSSNTPIVRYLELPQPPEPLSVRLPLRILGMIASPKDLADLDVKREKQRVEKAIRHLLARGLVELTWLPGQTWQDLQRSMHRGPWHIFHFIGHGGFDPNTDEGLIALKDDEGRAQILSATHLGRLLADHRTLRLVVLNSCEGARGSEKDIFSSTAAILVRRGVPAVLAMQYEITDRAAIELSRAFYEALADSLPVDMAVSEARKAISLGVVNTVEWGTPVLYMRSPNGVLFDLIQNPTIQEEQPAHLLVPSLLPIPPASLAPTRQAVPEKVVEPSAPVVPPSEMSTPVPAASVPDAITVPSASELFTVPSAPEAASAPPDTMIPQKLTKLDRGISRGRMVLLIGLALLIVVASVGLVSAVRSEQIATGNAQATATAIIQANTPKLAVDKTNIYAAAYSSNSYCTYLSSLNPGYPGWSCALLLANNGNSDLTWHWSSPFTSIGGYPPYLTIPAYGTISAQKTETIEIDVDGPPVYSCPTQIDIVLVGPVNTAKVVWSCS